MMLAQQLMVFSHVALFDFWCVCLWSVGVYFFN